MYLRKVTYQLGSCVKSLVICFHKPHLENLALSYGGRAPPLDRVRVPHKLALNSWGIGTAPETWSAEDGREFGNRSKSQWMGKLRIESIW
jgi:hypothetical protein